MRFPVVILDLNGTLVDTLGDLADALNEQLWSMDRPTLTADQVRQWPGENLRAILKGALALTGSVPTDLEINQLLHEFRDRYQDRLGARAVAYPGTTDVLAQLHAAGVQLALLTNKPLVPSLKLLQQLDIAKYFTYMLAGDADAPRKPDPTGLLELMHSCGGDEETTLMVGSSRIDLETARNAGVRVALVNNDHSRGVHGMGADYVLDEISRLPHLVLGTRPSGLMSLSD
jgi:phosphoglycolate phosphatase